MILETTKEWYKNQTGAKFKRFHWWDAVRHQPKWRVRSDAPSTMDAFASSSEAATEEEVTRSTDQDRAKTAARKGKRKEGSSSLSMSSSSMGSIMSILKKLGTSFTMA
jgi:hypothetical protein